MASGSERFDRDYLPVITRITRKYGAKTVILFGSMLEDPENARDIDLGVLGVEGSDFFRFYNDLSASLDKPVDLVDLKYNHFFNELIFREGKVLYG